MGKLHIQDLDSLDRKIISLLQEQGRRTNANIARITKVHESTVKKRIDRLVENGVVKVLAVLDPEACGYTADAIVNLRVQPGCIEKVARQLTEFHEIAWIGCLSGRFDMLIEVVQADHDSLFEFIDGKLSTVEGIIQIETSIIMRKPKIDYEWELPAEFRTIDGPFQENGDSDGKPTRRPARRSS